MAPELMPPLTDVSSIYGIGMFIDGALLTGEAVLEKPNDLACRIGSARRAGSSLDRSMFGIWADTSTRGKLGAWSLEVTA